MHPYSMRFSSPGYKAAKIWLANAQRPAAINGIFQSMIEIVRLQTPALPYRVCASDGAKCLRTTTQQGTESPRLWGQPSKHPYGVAIQQIGVPKTFQKRFSTDIGSQSTNTPQSLFSTPRDLERQPVRNSLASRLFHASSNRGEVPLPWTAGKILVTGAGGQVGLEVTPFLRDQLGVEAVIASDVKAKPELRKSGPFVYADVTNRQQLEEIVVTHGVTRVLHLAAVLSAVGEEQPMRAMEVNLAGTHNVLEIARVHGVEVFAPSSIAVFGPASPKTLAPDDTVLTPTTIYGITKVHQELLGSYYAAKFGVDFRSLRFPGILSYMTLPGGGTTDFAVEMCHEALRVGKYTCYLKPDTRLPLQFMPDSLKAVMQLLAAPRRSLTRCTYNVASVSLTPSELANHIRTHVPGFEVDYQPDFRQSIADSWPESVDDSLAKRDWGWVTGHGTEGMVKDMLRECAVRYYPDRLPSTRGLLEGDAKPMAVAMGA